MKIRKQVILVILAVAAALAGVNPQVQTALVQVFGN